MKVEMLSQVSIEVVTDASIKYEFSIPMGSPYEDVFKALETVKNSVEQLQQQSLKEKEEAEKNAEKKES